MRKCDCCSQQYPSELFSDFSPSTCIICHKTILRKMEDFTMERIQQVKNIMKENNDEELKKNNTYFYYCYARHYRPFC